MLRKNTVFNEHPVPFTPLLVKWVARKYFCEALFNLVLGAKLPLPIVLSVSVRPLYCCSAFKLVNSCETQKLRSRSELADENNKCSDRSMGSETFRLSVRNYDRPTDRRDGRTDGLIVKFQFQKHGNNGGVRKYIIFKYKINLDRFI